MAISHPQTEPSVAPEPDEEPRGALSVALGWVLAIARSKVFTTIVGVLAMLAAFFWGLPTFASYQEVWASMLDLEARYLLPLALAGAANLTAPSLVQVAALPGLRLRIALAVDWMTSAVTNTVPGGSAIATGMTWTMYRRCDLERPAIVRSVVVTGVWHTFVKFGTPLLALVWLWTERPVDRGFVQASIVGTALFAVVVVLGVILLAGPGTANALGSFLDRLPLIGEGWPERLDGLRTDTLWLLRRRWRSLTGWTLFGHGIYYLLLVFCLRALGVTSAELSLAAILAALAFGRLVTAIPITPGGLGVMELGLTAALAAVGTAAEGSVVAAVLLFRFFTFAMPIPLGAVAWIMWASRNRRIVQVA